jgi:hypothetical protein
MVGPPRRANASAKTLRVWKHRDNKKKMQQFWSNKIFSLFPWSYLETCSSDNCGKSDKDYGGQFKGLNFDKDVPLPPNIPGEGKLGIGLLYESDHKFVTHPGRRFCIKSEKNMDYLLAIEKALTILCDTKKLNMETLRVTSICGANTLAHTDSCRGVTPNWLMFHGEGGELIVKIFPSFSCYCFCRLHC